MSADIRVQSYSAMPTCRPLADVSFSPQVTGVSITASDQFGWDEGRIGYVAEGTDGKRVEAFLRRPVAVEDGGVIVVSEGAAVRYIGVVVEASDSSIVCRGYGRWAPRWGHVKRGGSARVTMLTILAHGLGQLPWLTPIELVDTNVRHAWSELQYRSVYDVIQQALAEGGVPRDTAGNALSERSVPWMWLVYGTFEDGRPRNAARFVPALPAAVPDLILSYDPLAMPDLTWQLDVVDAVQVAYQQGGKNVVSDWVTRPGVDPDDPWLRREMLTGSASPSGALAVAETFLATHSAPRLAGTIRFTEGEGFGLLPGQTVRMLTTDGPVDVLVSQHQSDIFNGGSSVTLGEPSASSWHGFARSLDRAVRCLERGRSLITGARV